jgi:small subunit ribosomal protein S11
MAAKRVKKIVPKKQKRSSYRGVVHIQASYHNTIVTITNIRGEVLCWSSAGACGFKGKRKSTTFAAKKAAETAARKTRDFKMTEAKILVTGPGQGLSLIHI